MKVKIGDKIYDPNEVPIMLLLSQTDKENISCMNSEANKYCAYPKTGYTEADIDEFMLLAEERDSNNG